MVPQRKLPEVIISTGVYKNCLAKYVYLMSNSDSMNQHVTKRH